MLAAGQRAAALKFGPASLAGLLMGLLAGCQGGYPIAIVGRPQTRVERPLPGELAVMLPFDVRPSIERKGKAPDIEAIIAMPYVCITTTRGNFVTRDRLYDVPYDKKEAESRFGRDAVVAAAVGENIVAFVRQAGISETATRLRPTRDEGRTWRLSEPPALPPMERIPPDARLWEGCRSEREARPLELRAAAAPLPASGARWLLRVRILHFYATFHQRTVTVTTSSSMSYGGYTMTTTRTNQTVNNFAPVANVVLDCELFLMEPQPALVWQRVVQGVACRSPDEVYRAHELVVPALEQALNSLVQGLAEDVPRIRAYLQKVQGGRV